MQAPDLDLLTEAALEAGKIARGFFQENPKTWEKDAGAGPVTEADLAVNEMLEQTLRDARPDYGWLSEESADGAERLDQTRIFTIDPIDGTRAFIEGSRSWSHSLAIVENGQPVAAVVYLPMMDKLYTAQRGKGARLNGDAMQVHPNMQVKGAKVLANKSNFRAELWQQGVPPVEQAFRSSLAYRMCLVAEGRFEAMLTLRPTWEWDIAAGLLMISEAGGKSLTRQGQKPVLNNPYPTIDGLLAGNEGLVTQLQAALA
ncbi:MAG: 3'(2'),5'-bisphosphate nucleotidase CysQ [Pseudomonadota bacterium]